MMRASCGRISTKIFNGALKKIRERTLTQVLCGNGRNDWHGAMVWRATVSQHARQQLLR